MPSDRTSDGPVKIPGVLLQFLERASVAMGCTRTRDLVPQIHWVSGWSVDPDGSTVHCYIPKAFANGLAVIVLLAWPFNATTAARVDADDAELFTAGRGYFAE